MGLRDSEVRLAELVGAFSLATDLGMGQPMEHVLRSWLIATRLGERLGLDAAARVALYYVMVLAWAGLRGRHRGSGPSLAGVSAARARGLASGWHR